MTIFHAIILGIVEGITEFLPISSTGHLILAGDLLGLPSTELLKSFDIAIQLGAILAAALIFSRKLLTNRHVFTIAIAGFIPTGIIGLLLHHIVKTYLFTVPVVTASLFLGGIAILIVEHIVAKKKPKTVTLATISIKQAILIGLAQSIALIPGMSRSAMTIMGGMLLGIERAVIIEYSFLLAIPTMVAATGYDLLKSASEFSSHDAGVIFVGFLLSFSTAFIAIRWLLHFIRSHTFRGFGVYRILVAGLLWLMMY